LIFGYLDIDECPANEHQCSHLCHNIPGGWACTCFRGYEVDPADSRDCVDVDECARGKIAGSSCEVAGTSGDGVDTYLICGRIR